MANWAGKQLGKYEVKELLGRGGMGEVYLALHPALEREVALKLIHSHLVSDPNALDRFQREAKVVAGLRHPGIIQIHDFDVEDDIFFMVMEYIPGQSLQQRLSSLYAQNKHLSFVETLRLLRLITEAVAYAHSQQVIHRDLKPSNVLLTTEDKPILVDFGLSKIIDEQQLTAQGAIMGTPRYMSPEQGSGAPVDARSDVYALGVIFYELATGVLPFSGETPVGLILKHINEPPAPPRSINPDLPEAVERVIQIALAKDPTGRYPSAQEFLKAVERLMTPPAPETPFLDETLLSTADDGRCPYRGLQTFEAEHAEFFFGREALVEQLVGQVADLSPVDGEARETRFLAVLGASGSGKSSVVRAGLVPTLAQDHSERWTALVMKPGSHPLEELAAQLTPVLRNEGDSLAATRQLLDNLTADGRALHLAVRLAWRDTPPEQQLLLVVDQFEEVFTLCQDEAERQRFIENLLYAAASSERRVLVVLTMRADFYHRCATYRDLAAWISAQQVLVGPMNEAELRRAIERPAEVVGLRFEPGLVDTILADVAQQPGALPLLQHALLELWERRQPGLLTLQAYRDSGGVTGAIAQRAETLYANFNFDEQAIVRRVMLRLTQPGEGTEDTRRRARMSEFVLPPSNFPQKGEDYNTSPPPGRTEGGQISNVVQKLTNARLLTTTRDAASGEEMVDVAHEALIRGWERLRNWIDEDRAALRTHRRLTEAAEEWQRHERDESYLYRGARLAEAEEWAESHTEELNELERAFVQASIEAREAAARAAQRARRRVIVGLTAGVAVLSLLLLVSVILGGTAFVQWRSADSARATAQAETERAEGLAFVTRLRLMLDENPHVTALMALAGQEIFLSNKETGQLAQILAEIPYLYPPLEASLVGHTDVVNSVAYSPDGHLLASGSWDKTIIIWDVAARQPVMTLKGHSDSVFSIAFSPDGSLLASGAKDGLIMLWDVASGRSIATLKGHTGEVEKLAFSPDGNLLASGAQDALVILWDVASGQPDTILEGHTNTVFGVAFNPNGSQLASGSGDQSIMLWDVASGERLTTLTGHNDTVWDLAFSPDGSLLASGAEDNTIILWDVSTSLDPGVAGGQRATTLKGHTGAVFRVVFSPDGNQLASGAQWDSRIIVWDVASGQPATILKGHTNWVRGLAFSPDGSLLASGSDDDTIILWDMAGGPPATTLTGHAASIDSVTFSPDNKQLASGSGDNTVILWDVASGEPLTTLTGHGAGINSVTFSPDGSQLASGSGDGAAIIWDVAGGQPVIDFRGHAGSVWDVALSPDGSQLASGSSDGVIILWDMASGRATTTLTGHRVGAGVSDVTYSPDGRLLASGASKYYLEIDETTGQPVSKADEVGNDIILWDVTTGHAVAILQGHTGPVNSVAFGPDSKYLASGSDDDTIILWDVATGQPITTLTGHTDDVQSVAFSPDGSQLASGSDDDTIILWDVASGQLVTTLTGHTGWVSSVAFSPDGIYLASGSGDDTIILWDMDSGRPVTTLEEHTDSVRDIVFSPDGKQLVSGLQDGSIIVWEVASGQAVITLNYNEPIDSLAFSPDGSQLISNAQRGAITIWDVASSSAVTTLPGSTGAIWSLAFSPDGSQLATSGDTINIWDIASGQRQITMQVEEEGPTRHIFFTIAYSPNGRELASGFSNTIIIWDAATGQRLSTLEGHTEIVRSLAYSPDGRKLASGSDDSTVIVWDVVSGQRLFTLEGHTLGVASVAFSPDGRQLLSSSYDDSIIAWDVVSGQRLTMLRGHTESINSVAFSPDGSKIASGSDDQTIQILDARFTQSPCEWLMRNLSRSEWEHRVSEDEPYQEVCPGLPVPGG